MSVVVGGVLALSAIGLLRYEPPDMPVSVPDLAPEGARADLIEVRKAERLLLLKRQGRVLQTYRVALGFDPVGHKRREGDGRTPEGRYVIDWRNPQSRFHLSLHVSYPGPGDIAAAREAGLDPGGDIMIHGQPNSGGWWCWWRQRRDWTAGCIAVSNAQIREIWSLAADGTPIVINP